MHPCHLAIDDAPFDDESSPNELLAHDLIIYFSLLFRRAQRETIQGRNTVTMYFQISRISNDNRCFTFSSKLKYLQVHTKKKT